MTTLTSSQELLETAERLAPEIRSHAEESEQIRRMAPATFEALRDAGLFRYLFRDR